LGAHINDDPVTLVLLALMAVLSVPVVLFVVLRVTRPPFQIPSFRWLYLTWACVMTAGLVWNINRTVRFSMDQAGADNYVRLAFLLLGAISILIIGARHRYAFFSELTSGVLMIFSLFSLWGLASTSWSVFPTGTLYKSLEYCTQLALLALTASLIHLAVRDPRKRPFALKRVFDFVWLLIYMLIASVVVGILVWPEYAIREGERDAEGLLGFSIQGVLPAISSNAVGQLGAIIGIVALVRLLYGSGSRVLYGSILAISLPIMVLTQSRSPILAFLVAVVIILLATRRFVLLALTGALFSALLFTQQGQLIYEFMRRGQSESSLTSLTGRVDYWKVSLDAVGERPFGGYGAYSGGRYVLSSVLGDQGPSTVHSLWVEVMLDTGVPGLILLTLGVGATWYWLLKLRPFPMNASINSMLWVECLGVLTVLSVRSFFGVEIVWDWNVLFFGLVLVFISVMRRQVAETHYAGANLARPLQAIGERRPSLRR